MSGHIVMGQIMPKDTPVDAVYQALKREGKDKGTAARIAQAKTGLSLATGKPPKGKKKPKKPAAIQPTIKGTY